MKKLLVDYIPFEVAPEALNEAMSSNGKLIVKGVLQRAEAKNQNGRVYPMELLQREAKKYTGNFIKEKRALGELDHPDSSVVNLNNVSHNVLSMDWDGNDLLGTIEVLTTPTECDKARDNNFVSAFQFCSTNADVGRTET